jgi:hypothetical protein
MFISMRYGSPYETDSKDVISFKMMEADAAL